MEGEPARHEIPRVAPRQMHPKVEPLPRSQPTAGITATSHRRIINWEEHDATTRYHVQVSDDGGAPGRPSPSTSTPRRSRSAGTSSDPAGYACASTPRTVS
jgi:hypothetical protein